MGSLLRRQQMVEKTMGKMDGNSAPKLRNEAPGARIKAHTDAIDILRGTNAQLGAAVVITAGSALFIAIILAHVTAPWHVKLYVAESCVFMAAQTFFAAKTLRDLFTAGLPCPPPGAQWMKGNAAWQAGVGTAVSVAAAFLLHSLVTVPDIAFEPHFCLCLGAFFLVASCVNLAKCVRDRLDADAWEDATDATDSVLVLARGTFANQVLVFSSFGVAVLSVVVGAAAFELSMETKGFLVMGQCFQITSAFWLAKTVRDSKEPVHSPLHPSQKDWVLSIVSVAVASVLLYGYLWTYMQAGLMPFDKVLFFLVSCFFSLFSTSWVSKYLRDQIDVDALELACAPSAVAS